MIGIVNAHMFGQPTEPGEHIDWSTPDVKEASEWLWLLEGYLSVAEYAERNPHMIVFEVNEEGSAS